MKTRTILFSLAAGSFLATSVQAETIFLRALMDGEQANQGNGTGSGGTGVAYVTYDDVTNEVTWNISWEGLDGNPTAMHFHGPAPAGQNAGVAQGIGVGSNPAVGAATITAAQGDDLLNGLWYVNLHTSTQGGGEIRGQVLPAAFQDDFSNDLSKWTESTRGLENNAPAGYDAPEISGGEVTLGGTTNSQYWFGNSLVSGEQFDSRLETEIHVKRVSLAGSGTAWRSSLWILGDNGHYLHYSQNVGETGWSWNARDDGGTGTAAPTGGGNNIASLDGLDTDGGMFEMGMRLVPTGAGVEVTMLHDGAEVATHMFSNFPTLFNVVLTGQARAGGDTVTAIFDDLAVYQEVVENLGPAFTSVPTLADGRVGVSYSGSLAETAEDPEGDEITYSKVSGPAWLQVAPDGSLSGTPGPADAGANEFVLGASDGNSDSEVIVTIRVSDPSINPTDDLFGWWPLNEGEGDVAADISGNGRDAAIVRVDTGGLGAGGSAWVEDPECGSVLSFNGDNGTGSYAIMTDGTPGNYGELPLFTTEPDNTFTWSLWVRAEDNAANNDIILGNRYAPGDTNTDFGPRQFIKFDSNNFEFDTNNVQGVDYDDIVGDQLGRWVHHVIVKDGSDFTYYRDGQEAGTGVAGGSQTDPMPLFFGGQGNFAGTNTAELWRGALFDVRLFTAALSSDQVTGLYANKGVFEGGGGSRLGFAISGSGDDLVLTWDSLAGKLYTVRSETDPSSAEPLAWPVFDGRTDLEATPPQNTLTIPRPDDPFRLFVIEEFDAPPVAIFSDDFESGQGNWSVGSDDGNGNTAWELGAPGSPGPVSANSGTNAFGTNLTSEYGASADVWLRSPAVDLTGAGGATLNYAEWRDIEATFDSGSIRVLDAADDSEIAVVQQGIEGTTGGTWISRSVSLPAAALDRTVKVEFRLMSDDFQEFAGWYLDDVVVTVP